MRYVQHTMYNANNVYYICLYCIVSMYLRKLTTLINVYHVVVMCNPK